MNTIEKHRLLVERLYQKTSERLLSWVFDEATDEVDLSISGKMISLGRGDNSEGIPVLYVKIRTAGNIVDQFDDETIGGVSPNIGDFESYFQLLVELYKVAKRQANGSEDVLDNLLQELDEIQF